MRKENEVALQRAEMQMFRWMCDIKAKDKKGDQACTLNMGDAMDCSGWRKLIKDS